MPRYNNYDEDCCIGKFANDERDLCDVCDSPLPIEDVPIGSKKQAADGGYIWLSPDGEDLGPVATA